MPALPAPVAMRAEKLFARPVRVLDIRGVAPGLTALDLRDEAVSRKQMHAGGEIEFRVTERDFRHFTIADVTAAEGVVRVLLSRARPPGPALAWLDRLTPGDEVLLFGPGRPLRVGGPSVVLGDLTAVGFARALLARSLEAGTTVRGAVEVTAADVSAVAELLPGIDVLTTSRPGTALGRWLGDVGPTETVHLAGHVPTIAELRTRLRAAGVERRRIKPHAYWAPGKRGL